MERLKVLRESKGVTQSQLGEFIGAKKSAVSLWESGKRQPDQETLVRLAAYFEVTVDYLLGRDEQPAPQIDIMIRSDMPRYLAQLNPQNRALLEEMARKLFELQQHEDKK